MRGLTIIVAAGEPARLRAALRLAAATAALGARVRLFLDEEAVPAITDGSIQPLLATAGELGAEVTLCQTGLAAAELDLRALHPRLSAGGLVGLLGDLRDDRLVIM